jgi:thermitase
MSMMNRTRDGHGVGLGWTVLALVVLVAGCFPGLLRAEPARATGADAVPPPVTATLAGPTDTEMGLRYVPGELIIKLRHPISASLDEQATTSDSLNRLLEAAQVSEFRPLLAWADENTLEDIPVLNRYYTLKVPVDADILALADMFRQSADLELAVPNYLLRLEARPDDSFYEEVQWPVNDNAIAKLRAPAAWSITTGSSDIVVAVLDTGVDFGHPDLDSKRYGGWNCLENNALYMDDHGHGTAVAGIIAAESNNGQGIAGVSWGARIMPVKVCYRTGDIAMCPTGAIQSGIAWAVNNNAKVINISSGGTSTYFGLFLWQDAVNYAYSENVVVVVSAGNDREFLDSSDAKYYLPAELEHVIVAGATNKKDEDCRPTAGGGYSEACDWGNLSLRSMVSGLIYGNHVGTAWGPRLDVMAPGSADIWTTWRGGGYVTEFGGTSASAPFVSGLAALILSVNPGLDPHEVEQIIKNNAQPLDPYAEGYPNDSFGWGRIDFYAAVYATPLVTPVLLSPSGGSTVGSVRPSFDWTDTPTASSYEIDVSRSPTFSWVDLHYVVTSGSAYSASSDLQSSSTYYWRVRAWRGFKSSDWSDTNHFNTPSGPGPGPGPGPGDQAPASPSPLSASTGFQSLIHLTWNDVSNESGYKIYRNNIQIDQVGPNVTTYPDSGLSCGSTYSYYITAYNSYGESVPSNTVAATPDCPTSGITLCSEHDYAGTCKTYTSDDPNLHDDGLGNLVSSLKLHGNYCVHLYDNTDYQGQEGIFNHDVLNLEDHGWNERAESVRMTPCDPPSCWVTLYADSYYGGGYKTFYSDDHDLNNDGLGSNVESLILNDGCIVDLYEDTDYQGQRGTFEQNVPDLYPHNWSNRAESFQLRAKPPTGPSNLSANAVSPWQINLAWQDNSDDEDGFRIYRDGLAYASLGPGTTSYQDTELACGTGYSYYVKAFNGIGESGESNTALAATHSCPTYGVTLCEHALYRGACKTFESDDPDLANDGFSENASSLRVYGYCMAELYDDPNYEGQAETFEQNIDNLHHYGWGDLARSIKVHSTDTTPPNVEVVSPAECSYLTSDSVTIYANISDSQSGISSAQFHVWYDDGGGATWHYVGSDTEGSDGWSTQWDASGISDQTELGFHALSGDNAGNIGGDGNYLVTLDRTPPTSWVNALPSTEASTSFAVGWSGWDNAAGIACYDVQYRVDGWWGWYDWLIGTTCTLATFADGRDGHTYHFRCRARDNAGHLEDYPTDADTLTTVQTCGVPSADAYEQDDSHTAAKWIEAWQPQTHNLHDPGDQDWVKFQATAGDTYTIQTSLVDADCDTHVFLYDTDGVTLLDDNDDIDLGVNLASRIKAWVAPVSGIYYAMVRHWNEHVGGCGTTYDLTVLHISSTVHLPVVMKGQLSALSRGEDLPVSTPPPSASPSPTLAPTLSFISTPSITLTPTASPMPSMERTPYPAPTITATIPVTDTATPTPTPSPAEQQEPEPEPTTTPTATPTQILIPTPTEVPTPSATREEEPPP